MKDNIFIDSNIFLYAFDKRDSYKQNIAKNIVLNNYIISTQVINEVSNNLLKKFKMSNMQVSLFVESCYYRYNIINFNKKIFEIGCDIRDNYKLSYFDSLIIATALYAKCNIVYSEDMHNNQKIENLKIINPFKG